ncbi:MAG: PKD domain-containing protein [Cyclobacteriaceae bacterium]
MKNIINNNLKITLLIGALAFLPAMMSCGGDEGDLTFSGTVSGTVTDKVSGNPIGSARIELKQGGTTIQSTVTGTDGNYSMTDEVKGEESYTILASANGYEDVTINTFSLTSGNNTKEADIQLTPKTPELEVVYPDNQTQLNIEGGVLRGTVTIRNSGEGVLTYTDLGTPAWMSAADEDGNRQGTIAGNGGSETITIIVDPVEVQNFINNNNQTTGTVSIDTDQNVNGDKEITVNFTYVPDNQPPSKATISFSPAQGPYLMRQLITFEATDLEDDNDQPEDLKVSWNFGEANGFTTPSTAKSVTNRYVAAGTYTVSMRVIDSEGAELTVTESIIIKTNDAPTSGSLQIDLSAADLFVNTDITFSAINWTDDQLDELSQLSYSWDFGDGSSGTEFSPSNVSRSFSYATQGSYVVTLTVRDLDNGTAAATNTFVVKPVSDPSVSTSAVETSDRGSNYAIVSGEITDIGNGSSGIQDYGFVIGTSSGSTLENNIDKVHFGTRTDLGSFAVRFDGLFATTTYFVRSFALNESGNVVYGNERDFRTTIPVAPLPITVNQITSITQTTAKVEVLLNNLGIGITISEIGIVVNESASGNPTLDSNQIKERTTSNQVGTAELNLSGLTAGNTYRVTAYVLTSDGSILSTPFIFTTN